MREGGGGVRVVDVVVWWLKEGREGRRCFTLIRYLRQSFQTTLDPGSPALGSWPSKTNSPGTEEVL